MAFVRDKAHTSLATTAASITGSMPSYEVGDLLIAYAIADGNRVITVDGAWTVLEQGNGIGAVGYSIAYIENATGSETAPVFSLSANDTATAIVVSIGGVPVSGAIEASTSMAEITHTRQEFPFTGVTTITDNALVLHLFGNSALGGCYTTASLIKVSDEIGYAAESAYMFEETIPTAGASSSGNMLQYGSNVNAYKSISIADASSGTEIKPSQIGGGLELINALQGQETLTWLIGGNNTLTTPSDVATPADYGTILGKSYRTGETIADAADTNVNPFLAAAKFRIDRGEFYSGIRFAMDRFGTGGTLDATGKAVIVTAHLLSLNSSVKLQTKNNIGVSLVLESGSDDYDDYVVHTVTGSDSSNPKVTPLDAPCLLSPDYASPIASSGTFDEANLLKVAVIGSSLNAANLNIFVCNIGLLSAIELVGGSSLLPINQEHLADVAYANLAYYVQNSGSLINSYTPWIFGNGVLDTYVDFEGKTFSFPEQGADTGALVNDDFFGLTFESTAGSDINCEGMTLASTTPFYLDVINALGTINFTNSIISNSKICNIRGDFTGTTFTPVTGTFIDDYDAIIDDVTVNGILRLNSLRDLTGVEATKIVLTQGGTYNFTGCLIDEVENTSGLAVTINSDVSIATQTETSGTIEVIDASLVFSGIDSWIVYANATDQDANTNPLGSGTIAQNFRFTYVASTTYYLRLVTGTDTILKTVTPTQAGETNVDLTTSGLLVTLPTAITQAVWDQGTTGHTDVGTFGYLLQDTDLKINHLELSVFVDTEAVTNGNGTEESPHNNFDDAKTTADALGSNTIIIKGDATVNVTLKNFNIKGGSSRATIDLNGQNVDGSRFEKITITGTASEPVNPKGFRATNCVIDGVSGLQGVYIDCLVKGTLTPADESEINIDDCLSGIAGLGRPVIELNGLTNVKLSVRRYSGGLTLQNSTSAGNEVTLSTTEGKITLDNTCTAGAISIRGIAQLTDNSAGATVDIDGLLETVDVNSDLDITLKNSKLIPATV